MTSRITCPTPYSTIPKTSTTLADKVLSGQKIELSDLTERYPEIGYYSGVVAGSPDGSKLAADEQETRRTELSLMCLVWILQDNYEQFTACQKPEVKLSRERFANLVRTFKRVLPDAEAVNGMFATMAIHDLGKIAWFKDEILRVANVTTDDHDEVLKLALQHKPSLLPSYQALSAKWQSVIKGGWEMDLNIGQATQAENLPYNFKKALGEDKQVVEHFVLHEILDVAGVCGHINLNGSLVLTEPVLRSYQWVLEALQSSSTPEEAYRNILSPREKLLGFKETHLVRLAAMCRLFTNEEGSIIKEAFSSLPKVAQEILTKELNITGTGDAKGILLYYAPQTLVNLFKNEDKKEALSVGFQLLARLFQEVRCTTDLKGGGVYTLNIRDIADFCAKNSLDVIKRLGFEIKNGAARNVHEVQPIQVETFKQLPDLTNIPGNKILFVGTGGGSDGIQAACLSQLTGRSVGVVSVRAQKERRVQADTVTDNTYKIEKDTKVSHFDRYMEPLVAEMVDMYVMLDPGKNLVELQRQLQMMATKLGADTIVAVDTGGDALYPMGNSETVEISRATPDQDLRVLKALQGVNGVANKFTMEIATGIDSPPNVETVLRSANAQYYSPSTEDSAKIQKFYKSIKMDPDQCNTDRFGKTATAWQLALHQGQVGVSHQFMPLPLERVLSEKPWNPVVYMQPSIKGVFVMELNDHIGAISIQSARM